MSLIDCPECGRYISNKAAVCIGCGYPIHDAVIAPEYDQYLVKGNGQSLCAVGVDNENDILDEKSEKTTEDVVRFYNKFVPFVNIILFVWYVYGLNNIIEHNGDRRLLYYVSDGNYRYVILITIIAFVLSLTGFARQTYTCIIFSVIFYVTALPIIYLTFY